MKVNEGTRRVETSGLEAQDFKIQTSAKAFEILSSGLYNDKIQAVIRELCCNAYDAHVAAGKKDVPFEVHLPNTLEPFLAVKDYGTGLCEDDIYELYTTYFSSDKTDSNLFVGALGLGSKSPFAVTDQFTVESRFEGTKSLYTCFISENKTPQVAKVFSEDTEEANGLTVQVAVSSSFTQYGESAKRVLRPFSPLPTVVGGMEKFEIESYESNEKVKGAGWRVINDNSTDWRISSVVAVQGNVEYPLTANAINEEEDEDALQDFLNSFTSSTRLIIQFPIGTLDVAASREELSLNKQTMKNVAKRLKKVKEEFFAHLQEKIDKCESELDVLALVNTFQRTNMKNMIRGFTWRGVKIDNVLTINTRNYDKMVLLLEKRNGYGYGSGRQVLATQYSHSSFSLRYHANCTWRFVYYDYDTEARRKGIPKLKNIIRNDVHNKPVFVVFDDLQFLSLFKGNIPYENLSEIEDPFANTDQSPSSASTDSQANKPLYKWFQVFNRDAVQLKGIKFSRNTFINEIQEQTSKKILYVISKGVKKVEMKEKVVEEDMLRRNLTTIKKEYPSLARKVFYPAIVRVTRGEAAKSHIKNNPQMVKLEDAIEGLVKRDIKKGVKARVISELNELLNRSWAPFMVQFYKKATMNKIDVEKLLQANSSFLKAYREVKRVAAYVDRTPLSRVREEYSNALENFDSLIHGNTRVRKNKVNSEVLRDHWHALNTTYPLISCVDGDVYRVNNMVHFLHYVNAIDEKS